MNTTTTSPAMEPMTHHRRSRSTLMAGQRVTEGVTALYGPIGSYASSSPDGTVRWPRKLSPRTLS
jgi:hypothetical protein